MVELLIQSNKPRVCCQGSKPCFWLLDCCWDTLISLTNASHGAWDALWWLSCCCMSRSSSTATFQTFSCLHGWLQELQHQLGGYFSCSAHNWWAFPSALIYPKLGPQNKDFAHFGPSTLPPWEGAPTCRLSGQPCWHPQDLYPGSPTNSFPPIWSHLKCSAITSAEVYATKKPHFRGCFRAKASFLEYAVGPYAFHRSNPQIPTQTCTVHFRPPHSRLLATERVAGLGNIQSLQVDMFGWNMRESKSLDCAEMLVTVLWLRVPTTANNTQIKAQKHDSASFPHL